MFAAIRARFKPKGIKIFPVREKTAMEVFAATFR
jgi:hypothetical protein